jgi:hypothetical protein
VVRITTVDEDPNGELTIQAEDWPFGVATAALYSTQSGDGTAPDVDVDPGNANAPVIFDLPKLAGSDPEIGIGTGSTNLNWGGCEVWISQDGGTSYGYAGRIEKAARHGTLTATLASGSSLDTVNTLSISLAVSLGTLVSATDSDRDDLLTLCYVDGELIAFKTATLTGANAYNLTSLRRGAYGTAIASHSSGTKFMRLDDAVFRYPVPPSRVGASLLVKLVSFNIWGSGLQDIATVPSYSYTPTTALINPPYPDTCTATVTTTAPASGSGHHRHKFDEEDHGIDDSSGTPRTKRSKFVTVDWTHTAPYPATLLTGFRVVVHTGTDPNDEGTWLKPEMIVAAGVRKAVFTLPAKTSTTTNASVQALYGTVQSSWRLSTGSVVVDPDTIPIAVQDLTNSPDSAVGSRLNANNNLDNLVPNPNGELGTAASGKDPEGNLLVNDSGNAFAGQWVRRLGSGITTAVESYLTKRIPCMPGDIFVFSGKAKRTTGSTPMVVALRWADTDGTYGTTQDTVSVNPGGTSYVDVTLTATCPAGKTGVWLHVSRIADGSASTFYLDNLSVRRAVKPSHMEPDSGFRLVNALGNSGTTTGDRVWYCGNDDPATLGGAPNINRLTVVRRRWGTGTAAYGAIELQLAPAAASDNLDAMRYATIVWYKQTGGGGTSGTLVELETTYHTLPDRLFQTPGTDSAAGNKSFVTCHLQDPGIDAGDVAVKITLYNVHGPSDTHCFYSPASAADGTTLVDNGTSWPAGLTGGTGGGSGGGAGGGGNCIAPWHTIVMADWSLRQARHLKAGDVIRTFGEHDERVVVVPIQAVSTHLEERVVVTLETGERIFCSRDHRFRRVLPMEWIRARDLIPGDLLDGSQLLRVISVVDESAEHVRGAVVRITVPVAHTYMLGSGPLCHNMKPLDP